MAVDRSMLTLDERWSLADYLAEVNLPAVNASSAEVHPKRGIYSVVFKRMFDIVISFIGLLITLPVNLVILIGTAITVGRPIFFKQTRIGKDGSKFTIVKFRNMKDTRDERGELLPASKRVTKFGKIVRKASLDELLNLWSVFKGDMSLIGPRPLVEEYYSRFSSRHIQRFEVKPGLECPPRSRSKAVRTWQDQFEDDIWYVENISFKTDLMLCIRLIQYTFDSRNASSRGDISTKGIFMGYGEDGKAINLEQISEEMLNNWANSRKVE